MRNDFSGAILKNIVIDEKNRKILIDAGILKQNQVKHNDVLNDEAYNYVENDEYI